MLLSRPPPIHGQVTSPWMSVIAFFVQRKVGGKCGSIFWPYSFIAAFLHFSSSCSWYSVAKFCLQFKSRTVWMCACLPVNLAACRYDPRSNTWSPCPVSPRCEVRTSVGIGVIGDNIYAVGGQVRSQHWNQDFILQIFHFKSLGAIMCKSEDTRTRCVLLCTYPNVAQRKQI